MRHCKTYDTLVALIGEHNTLTFIQEKGGQEYYVPRHMLLKANHELVLWFGERAAKSLCRYYDGGNVTVPLGKKQQIDTRNHRIIMMHKDGVSKKKLCKLFGLTERAIRKIIADSYKPTATRPTDAQLDMFGLSDAGFDVGDDVSGGDDQPSLL